MWHPAHAQNSQGSQVGSKCSWLPQTEILERSSKFRYPTLANYWCLILVLKKLRTKGISQPKLAQFSAAPGCVIKVLWGDQRSLHPLNGGLALGLELPFEGTLVSQWDLDL